MVAFCLRQKADEGCEIRPKATIAYRPPRPNRPQVRPGEGCKADIYIIVDSSGSIKDAGPNNYDLLKNFVSNVILGLPIGEDRVRVALSIYSRNAALQWDYNEYFKAADLVKEVDDLYYIGAETYTSTPFQVYIDRLLYDPAAGNRGDVQDIIILITDGNTTVEDRDDLKRVLLKVKQTAMIFGVGVGNIDLKEIEMIVTPPISENYVGAENFAGLINVLDNVVSITGCTNNAFVTVPEAPQPPTRRPTPSPPEPPLPNPSPFPPVPPPGPSLPPIPFIPTLAPFTPTPPESYDASLAVFAYSVDNTKGSPGNFPFASADDYSDKFNIAKNELVIPVDGLYYFSVSAGVPANTSVDYSMSFNSLNLKPALRRSHTTGSGADTMSRDAMFLLSRDTVVSMKSPDELYSDAYKVTSMSAFSVSDIMLDPKYFYVYRRNGKTNKTKIEFPDVLLNNQNDYNTITNEYRCPITSMYIFTFSVFVNPSENVNAKLKVGSLLYELVRNHTKHGDQGGDVLSRTVMALCYENMTVSVQLDGGSVVGGPDLTTGFMGFSIKPDFSKSREVYWSLRRNEEFINNSPQTVDLPFTHQDHPGYPFAEEQGGEFSGVKCPYTGWYFVHLTVATKPQYPVNLFITVGDEPQVAVFRASRWHNRGVDYLGRSAILKCKKDDIMKVQIGGFTAIGNVYNTDYDIRGSSFLGFLVYVDDNI